MFPTSTTTSNRFRHFSVFVGDNQAQPWSICNRVVITCDTETLSFTSKCCGAGFCVHRNVCKWYISQLEPELLEGQHSEAINQPSVPHISSTILYPPSIDQAKQMVNYLFNEKGIPPVLPVELTVNLQNFKTRYMLLMFLNVMTSLQILFHDICVS